MPALLYREVFLIFFTIIVIILTFVIFRKQKIEFVEEPETGYKRELIFCLLWFLLYIILAMLSCAFNIDIINDVTNWLFLVLFPLLILTKLRKEKLIQTLKEIGLKRMDKNTLIKVLLVYILYIGVIILVFSLGEETASILSNIPEILVKFLIYFCLMIFTAGFTEEFFFRGIIQRCLINLLKKPYIAILVSSILFALYHFPFAFYLWDGTAGNIINSLKMIMTEHLVAGFALGLIYYKSNKNLWSSIIFHACSNAIIMSFSVIITG